MEHKQNEKLLPYLREAHDTYKNGFESDEMRDIFTQNCIEEIKGHEVEISFINSGSFILQDLIKYCNLEVVKVFLNGFTTSWQDVIHNQSACHIFQSVLERFIIILSENNEDLDKEVLETIATDIKTIADELFNKEGVVTSMTDTYASHGFRSILFALSGVLYKNSTSTYKENKDIVLDKEIIPKGFMAKLKILSKILEELPRQKFSLLFTETNGCRCACYILKLLNLRLPKRSKHFCNAILNCSNEEHKMITILAKDKIGSRLLECIIEMEGMFPVILSATEEIIPDLCLHPVGNFVIQKLIQHAPNNDAFKKLFDIVTGNFTSLLVGNKMGVIHSLAEKCISFPSLQDGLITSLTKMLNCADMGKRFMFVPLLAALVTLDEFNNTEDPIEEKLKQLKIMYHGSLLLQTLTKYNNIGLLLRGLTEVHPSFLLKLTCDPKGSHFIDKIFSNDKVLIRKQRQFLSKMQPYMGEIACDKYGSRVLDNLWKMSDLEMKINIARALSKTKDLSTNQYGKYFYKSFGINNFSNRKEQWVSFQRKCASKRNAFQDIIESLEPPKKVKRIKTDMK